jgi:3-oxoacyl-[acyl-carrier protein] reductase
MRIINLFKRIINSLPLIWKVIRDILKYGGYCTVKVADVAYDKVLFGKNVLITGGGSGIGYAIAKKCISVGANAIITGRNEEKLQEAVNELNSPNAHYLIWDISKVDKIESKISEAVTIFGSDIDILVNNAGILSTHQFIEATEPEWDAVEDINSKGTFFMCQAFCRYWISEHSQKCRKILNITSQGGFVGTNNIYRMTKWDIRGLTEYLGKEMAKHNIIVNGIAPGVIKTNMQGEAIKHGDNMYTSQNPDRRYALPCEIAELANFLLSDASNFIIGQTIICDGGYVLK